MQQKLSCLMGILEELKSQPNMGMVFQSTCRNHFKLLSTRSRTPRSTVGNDFATSAFNGTTPPTSTEDRMRGPKKQTNPQDGQAQQGPIVLFTTGSTQESLAKKSSITISLRNHCNVSIKQTLKPYTNPLAPHRDPRNCG